MVGRFSVGGKRRGLRTTTVLNARPQDSRYSFIPALEDLKRKTPSGAGLATARSKSRATSARLIDSAMVGTQHAGEVGRHVRKDHVALQPANARPRRISPRRG